MDDMKMNHRDDNMQYRNLLLMIILSFVSMYIFMYSMVDSFTHVYSSLNQFYMAAVMTAPMVIIEMLVMKEMYRNKKKNLVISVVAVLALVEFFMCIRNQAGITDKQFLKSMIPHHAGAILMCEQSKVENSQIKKLCSEILSGQNAEIALMKNLLTELDK